MAKEGNRDFGSGALKLTLVFLVLTIVGLTAGIIVINVQKDDEEIAVDSAQILNDINNVILPMTTDEAVEYLDEEILRYDAGEIKAQLMIMKMNVYINDGQPSEALAVAMGVDEDSLGDAVKMNYYMAVSQAYEALGDTKMADYYYYDKYLVIYNMIFDGGGGGD